jgi:hypothetical protein
MSVAFLGIAVIALLGFLPIWTSLQNPKPKKRNALWIPKTFLGVILLILFKGGKAERPNH